MNFASIDNSNKSNKALFLDRDGVIIDYVPYLSRPNQIQIPQNAGKALKEWQDAGYLLIVITNQSGIGRGYFSMDMVELIHHHICDEYKHFDVKFQDFFICPHLPSVQCTCRKPSPQMIFQAAKKFGVNISQSFFVGDAHSDIECAINAGCQPVLVLTGRGITTSKDIGREKVSTFNNLLGTVELIKNSSNYARYE